MHRHFLSSGGILYFVHVLLSVTYYVSATAASYEEKVTIVDGQYQIGIYALCATRYGEEITFDYNSVTEV